MNTLLLVGLIMIAVSVLVAFVAIGVAIFNDLVYSFSGLNKTDVFVISLAIMFFGGVFISSCSVVDKIRKTNTYSIELRQEIHNNDVVKD